LHLERINAVLDPHEQLACIVLTTTAWTPDNGLLTPTLKVKRPSLEKRFGERFASWSGQRRPVVWDD
jgi:long-chain acyl-CoA synthetase